MLRVGLTGGIACGKSTVAAMLREHGCHVIEADPLAHEVMAPGTPAHSEVVREFGGEILDTQGAVDRKRLGAIVFADAEKRARLNAIIHPRVLAELQRRFADIAGKHPHGIAVVEAALLIEANYTPHLDVLVVAWCRPEQQMERLLARGLSREQAAQRIAAQMPLEEKKARADELIDCSGALEQTRAQVDALAARLRQRA